MTRKNPSRVRILMMPYREDENSDPVGYSGPATVLTSLPRTIRRQIKAGEVRGGGVIIVRDASRLAANQVYRRVPDRHHANCWITLEDLLGAPSQSSERATARKFFDHLAAKPGNAAHLSNIPRHEVENVADGSLAGGPSETAATN